VLFDPDTINTEQLSAVGDLGPEGIVFISADDSPTGKDIIAVSNEVSGTVTIFSIEDPKAELKLEVDGNMVANMDTLTVFDGINTGEVMTKTFTITNTGEATLRLHAEMDDEGMEGHDDGDEPIVTVSGENERSFIVSEKGTDMYVSPGESTTFDITLAPTAGGNFAQFMITSNIEGADSLFTFSLEEEAEEDMTEREGITLYHQGSFETGIFDDGAAEIGTYDGASNRLLFTSAAENKVFSLDMISPSQPEPVDTFDMRV